jgi:hypothetical protein
MPFSNSSKAADETPESLLRGVRTTVLDEAGVLPESRSAVPPGIWTTLAAGPSGEQATSIKSASHKWVERDSEDGVVRPGVR